jgi:hypothetical protein
VNTCSAEEGEFVVARFALHSGLRQSGGGLRPGFYGTAEAVPLSRTNANAGASLRCGMRKNLFWRLGEGGRALLDTPPIAKTRWMGHPFLWQGWRLKPWGIWIQRRSLMGVGGGIPGAQKRGTWGTRSDGVAAKAIEGSVSSCMHVRQKKANLSLRALRFTWAFGRAVRVCDPVLCGTAGGVPLSEMVGEGGAVDEPVSMAGLKACPYAGRMRMRGSFAALGMTCMGVKGRVFG